MLEARRMRDFRHRPYGVPGTLRDNGDDRIGGGKNEERQFFPNRKRNERGAECAAKLLPVADARGPYAGAASSPKAAAQKAE